VIAEMAQTEVETALQTNWLYLQDELARLRVLLLRYTLWQQARSTQPDLAEPIFYHDDPRARSLTAELTLLSTRCQAALAENDLPFKQLSAAFGLNSFEAQVLLLGLAIELDSTFETLLAQCQFDSGARQPTAALALRLCCESADEWVQARLSFSASRPLISWNLIHLEERTPSLLATAFHLDRRIVNALLGVNEPPAALLERMQFVQAPPSDQLIRPELAKQLGAIIQHGLAADRWPMRLVVNMFGARGAGRRTLAASACAQLRTPVLTASAADLLSDNSLALFLRESILQHAAAYLDCTDLPEEGRAAINRACAGGAHLILIGTTMRAAWLDIQPRMMVVPFEVPPLNLRERKRLWQIHLGAALNGQGDGLAAQFPFTPGDIQRVAESARTLALVRAPEDPQLSMPDVWQAARAHPQHHLSELARRIEPRYTWDDIVLPDMAQQQLIEIQQQVAQQTRVYEAWGFGKKLSRGRGVSALFSGSSGTGKTMAAEILAGTLNLELYRIDLSCVVSKYIGETEKNLARVFDEAERSSVILFFDEADALFGKRSEVKDAHDRYANIEINYLLQRMEDFQGLAILATNMRQALDEAFLRRLRFLIEFPFPDASQRAEIWRRSFPAEMPQQDLDIDFVARQFKIAGGNIRNIALNAAFLAAAEDAPVQMPHLIRATKREFDKIGKACLESDFGPYFGLVR
jgi:AAA+ superfamily predicted ATPase